MKKPAGEGGLGAEFEFRGAGAYFAGMRFLQFIAVLALGAFVAWLARGWDTLFENKWIAAGLWLGIILAFAGWVDWRAKRRERQALDDLARLPPEEREAEAADLIGRPLTVAEKARLAQATQERKSGS